MRELQNDCSERILCRLGYRPDSSIEKVEAKDSISYLRLDFIFLQIEELILLLAIYQLID